MEKKIKIALSILFLLCLLKMPYAYYEVVRLLAMVGFGLLAYSASKQNLVMMIVYILLMILFQPFMKIALGRALWNAIDVTVASMLLISLIEKPKCD